MDPAKRIEAVAAVARQELEHTHVPVADEVEQEESGSEYEEDSEDDTSSEQDVLDVSQPRQFGSRQSQRQRTQATTFGFQLDSSAIALTEDSELEHVQNN